MPRQIKRYAEVSNPTLAADDTTPEIALEHFVSGEIILPTGSTITTLTYYVAEKMGGTYWPAYDASGSAVTQTVAAERAYPLPTAIFGAAAVQIQGNAAGAVFITLKT